MNITFLHCIHVYIHRVHVHVRYFLQYRVYPGLVHNESINSRCLQLYSCSPAAGGSDRKCMGTISDGVPLTISETHDYSGDTINFYYYVQYEQGMYFRNIRHGYSTSPPFYLTPARLPHEERCTAYIPLKIYDIFFIYEWDAF